MTRYVTTAGHFCSLNASRVLIAMEIDALLLRLSSQHGSDLFLSTGAPPSARIDGVLTPFSEQPFKPGEVEAIANSLMDAEQRRSSIGNWK
jgi:twitching motility protein PilU